MSTVKGVVEAVSTKYGKFSVMVNDTWYGTKMEWCDDTSIQKGDTIEFDNGGGKFLKKVKRVSASSHGATPVSGSKSSGYSNIGVELGHASKLGFDVAIKLAEAGSPEFYKLFIEHTENVYKIMKSLRAKYEAGDTPKVEKAEPTPKEETPAPDEDIF